MNMDERTDDLWDMMERMSLLWSRSGGARPAIEVVYTDGTSAVFSGRDWEDVAEVYFAEASDG